MTFIIPLIQMTRLETNESHASLCYVRRNLLSRMKLQVLVKRKDSKAITTDGVVPRSRLDEKVISW